MPSRKTTEEFILDAKNVHGEKYDYSSVVYVSSTVPVDIICPVHGFFKQTPTHHLSKKRGCKKCNSIRLTKNDFLQRAKGVHGDKFTYGEYKSMTSPVEIFCREHGRFLQLPQNHIRQKQGCPKCRIVKMFMENEEFVDRSKKIHRGKYDYSSVVYERANNKVEIICPTHGPFLQTPKEHLSGKGCRKCSCDKRKNRLFSNIASEVHGNFYDYSVVKYVSALDKVKILCPFHGAFWQTPNNHVSKKHGCPMCAKNKIESKAEANISIFLSDLGVYFVREATFPGLKNPKTNRSLRCDFFLVDYKIIIEYDGIHHFKETAFGSDCASLENTKYRDAVKDKYFKEKKIEVVRIPYWAKLENELEDIKERYLCL